MPELALVIGALLLLAGAGGCPSCLLARSQLRDISLNQIKEQILSTLGLQHVPNITGRLPPRIPPLEDLYEQFQADQAPRGEDDEPDTTQQKIIAFAQPHPKIRHIRGKEYLTFKFSSTMLENKVLRAYLWLFTRSSQREDSSPLYITVFKVTSHDPPSFIEINSVKEARSWGPRGRWVSLDVKRIVSEWFKTPAETYGLAVQVSHSEHGTTEPSLISQRMLPSSRSESSSSFVPFLELRVANTKKPRRKRSIGLNCPENSEETRCCRYPLTVDFEEFGWDWVIAPKKYEANYCSGECPYVFLQKYPHTHIVHLANPGSAGPCCAPRKMSSISMLYFDQNFNIIYGLLPGMVVDRCGCS